MRVDPLHARYPFFEAARDAVSEADISPPRLVATGDPAVDRARERVERALMAGTVAPDSERWSARDELLSYPIARILVSLVDVPAAVEKYAEAEAATAAERFRTDLDDDDTAGLRSVDAASVDLDALLAEFGLRETVTRASGTDRREETFRVAVATYLRLSDPGWGDRWRLVNRELADGEVPVDRDELLSLLEEAVRRRVAAGLPFDVRGSAAGDELAAALDDAVTELRSLLSERDRLPTVETVAPAQFPPCVTALLDRAADGEDLPTHSQFALTAFLVSLGMDAEDVAERWPALAGDELDHRVTVLADEGSDGSQYPPPTCATMDAYGDCVNTDARCETVDHPLGYYAGAVADADANRE
ncbi:MAG: DNA primase [Haloplanus sp.]